MRLASGIPEMAEPSAGPLTSADWLPRAVTAWHAGPGLRPSSIPPARLIQVLAGWLPEPENFSAYSPRGAGPCPATLHPATLTWKNEAVQTRQAV
jgi:hypothetical protein